MGLSTVQDVKSRILQVFPRSSTEIPGLVDADFSCWVRAICRMYPWWFTEIRPGSVAGVFPITDYPTLIGGAPPGANPWFHRGWLVLDPAVDTYEFKAPYDDIHPEYGFHDAHVLCVDFVKLFEDTGEFRFEIPVRPPDLAHTRMNYTYEGQRDYPDIAWTEDFPEISILRIHPAVVRNRVCAVQFHLADCPNYTIPGDPSGDEYNRMVSAVPEFLVYYGLMKLAEFFVETELYQHYREVLYGNPPLGLTVPGTTHGGYMVDLIKEGDRQSIASDTRWEYYKEAGMPFGTQNGGRRSGRWGGRRGFGRGTYVY